MSDHDADPWNRRYLPGVRCVPCSARFPVGVHHPAGRPCGHVDLNRLARVVTGPNVDDPTTWRELSPGRAGVMFIPEKLVPS